MSLSLAALLLAAWGLLQRAAAARAGLLQAALALGLAAAVLSLQFGAARPALVAQVFGNPVLWAVLHAVTGLVLVALIGALIAAPSAPTLAITGLTVWIAWPLAGVPLPLRSLGAAAAWAAVGLLGHALVSRLRPGRALMALDRLLDPRAQGGWLPGDRWHPTAGILAAGAGTVAALAVPHLVTALGGVLLAAVAGLATWRHAGHRWWGLLPGILAIVLMLLWSRHLSGPLGGWIPSLVDGPFSPRAAQLLALLSLVAVVALAGAWPLHGATVPVLLAPAAIPVAGTFATLLVPDGVQWWQPLAAPLAIVAMAHALARRRLPVFFVAAGLFGLWTGQVSGALGGSLLVLTGWGAAVGPVSWLARVRFPAPVHRLAGLVPAVGVAEVLRGGMHGEITWLLVAVLVGAAALQCREWQVDPFAKTAHIPGANPG